MRVERAVKSLKVNRETVLLLESDLHALRNVAGGGSDLSICRRSGGTCVTAIGLTADAW
jgi:hypothetical protein